MGKSPTIKAYGRTWCHQQFHGLLIRMLVDDIVRFEPDEDDGIRVHIREYGGFEPERSGTGPTIWLALVDLFKEDGNV